MSESNLCYLWRVERKDGFTLYATDHDKELVFNGETYSPTVGVSTTKIAHKLGLGVDNLEVHGALDGVDITEQDIEGGLYDYAKVDIYIVDWTKPDTTNYHKVHGTFGNVYRSELGYSTEIRSQANVLSQAIGRAFQRTCDTKLGSQKCGVNLNTSQFSATATVTSNTDGVLILSGIDTYENGWFTLGKIVTAQGYTYGIKTHVGDTVTLWANPSIPIGVNDVLTVFAGCKQDAETCRTKFGNLVNFQGFPFIPGNDAVSSYPVIGAEDYNGGSLFK